MRATVRRTRRKYSDHEKAHALALLTANRGNVLRTSRELNIPERTLNDWSHLAENSMNPNSKRPVSPEYALEIVQLREEKEAALSDVFEGIARKYLARAGEDDVVAQTRGRDAVFSAAIAVDKCQLLRSQPTVITESSDSITSVLRDSIKLAARHDGLSEVEAAVSLYDVLKDDCNVGDLSNWPAEFRRAIETHLIAGLNENPVIEADDQ
jgi:transposase-like protein